MIKNILRLKTTMILFSILLTVVLGVIDYITGYELSFFVFYYMPISYFAWYIGKRCAIFSSIFSAIIWTYVDFKSGHTYSHWIYYILNGGIRLISFMLLSILLSKIRISLEMEKELSLKLNKALDEVKLLKGFLPICASCKNIRNDRGYWQQIEQYIHDHTDAEFTHTICPKCARKLYPDLIL